MAWVTVPGSDGVWEYDNAATISDTYPDSADGANSTISGGIRNQMLVAQYKFILELEKQEKLPKEVNSQKLSMTVPQDI
jgi:hypothetical protein